MYVCMYVRVYTIIIVNADVWLQIWLILHHTVTALRGSYWEHCRDIVYYMCSPLSKKPCLRYKYKYVCSIRICIHTYVYIYIYVCVCIDLSVHTHIRICMYIRIHVCTLQAMHTWYNSLKFILSHHTYVCTYVSMCICIYINITAYTLSCYLQIKLVCT